MRGDSYGAPPHPKPWPDDPKYDKDLLERGDKRNVEDKYRYWSLAAIREDLDKTRFDLHVAIENWQHDFNIGSIVRTANAFNVAAVHIIGRRQWNKRGAMVTNRYMNVLHHSSTDEFIEIMNSDSRTLVAVDNQPGASLLSEVELPKRAVLVFGGEGPGLSEEMIKASDKMVAIEQFGSTRSVNVGVAAGIVMYAWMQQHVL